MQEITSISKGESLSETVQKKMSGLTGDPLTESLYAIMQGQVNGEGNQLCRFTAAATNEDKVALDQLKEMKSKEHSISRLESLAKKKNDKVVFNSEANPEREPQYLLPEFVVETRAGKQVYITDTYCEPDCLRFCPSNSSNQVEISLSGLNVRAKASSQTVRTNKGFSEGVHYWEIICPISCSTLQIGVSNISNRNQTSEVYHQFRTTTPRVVGLELNLEKLTLNFWLNGRFIKERMKKIPEGDVWYPTIKFKEADYFVILNPFAQGKGQGVEEQNSNYLPNSLRSVESYVYQSFIESTLRGIIVAYGLTYIETKDSYETSIKNQLKINGSDVKNPQLYLLDYETLSKDSLIFAILKFENELDAIKYYHNNTDLKLLYPKQISKLLTLQDEKEKAKLGLPSYLDKFQELSKALVDLLISKVLNQDTIYYFLTYSGLSLKTSAQDLGQYLTQIHESLEQGTLPSYNIYQSHEKHQALSDVKYLEHSDKLLLLNDSQLKLIHRENGILDLESNPHFTMFPKSSTDMIRMNLSRRNLQFLIKNLDWSIINQSHFDIIQKFLQYCSEKSNTTHLLIPYIIAVQAINILLNVAITQYETLEQNFDILQEQEILHNFSKKHNKDLSAKQYSNNLELGFEYGKISVLDVHQLFNILLTLEDELWAKAQDDQIPTAVKDLWVKKGARLHTAYGRLSSLITFPQSVDPQSQFDPISMAEAGLINVDDKYGKLAMHQEFKVEIENVFQFSNNQHADLITALEKQLPNNLMLKGYPSWNVPLAKTLNNFPPSIHQNALTNKQACKPEKIDFIKTLPNSDFILTGAKDGSINLWNTRLKLNCNGAHNFKSKLYTDDDFELKHTSSVSKHIGSFVEEEKRSEGEVKLILKKSKIPKPVHYDEITEDILFTMFDEQEEVEESDEGVNSDNGDDYILDYQLDYACLPEQKQVLEMKKETSKEEEKVAVVDKQDKTERKESVTELEQPVEPNQDLLKQLKTMGFQSEIAKKALIITKNESISAAIDKYDEIFKKTIESLIPTTNVPQKKLKIADYECLLCTYINRGGKPNCEMCASAAPETAYIDEKSEEEIQKEKEEALKLQKEEEQKRILEEELKKKKEEEERRKKEEEQLAIQKFEELKQQAKAYYQNVEIVDYLFASFKQGKDSKPFLTAAVMHNSVQKRTDIQFVRLCYSSQYLRNFIGSHNNIQCKVCEIPFSTIDQCLQHVFQFHKTLIENDYPILIGGQLLQQKWNMKLNRHEFHNLRSEECGSITWPFEKLDAVVQIGNDITPEQPMFLIGIGKKEGQDHKTIIIEKIEFSSGSEGGELKIKIVEDDSQIFKQEGISNQVQEAHYCPKSQSLLILTTNHELYKFQVQIIDKKMTIHKKIMMTLQQDEQILRIDQGILQIRSLDRIRRFALDDNSIKKLHDKQIHQKQDKIDSSIPLEEEILKMSIDPMKVTIQDIKRYEKLMNGTPIGAQSNADIVIGNINERYHQGTKYYSKHHWNFDQVIDQSGPIEMEFEHPTSLISLNLELTFNCQDSQKLIEKLQHVEELTVKSDQIVGETQINTSSEQQPILNLGLLSIQGASELIQPSKQADQVVQKPQDYLPLVVHHHKGASYNQSYQVCRLVANNNSIFASNYPKPEFYIQHAHQHVMNIDKITIRSQTNSKCGAYPVGSGIIFISDNLQAFELSSAFHKFTYQEYKEWKQERIKDPTPLQQYEPVAYFEFDQETELTVDVDFKRPCKYIMLKPVGFRKKPVSFTQNINSVPMEIEFFGVSGQSFEDNLLTNNSSAESQAVTINNLWSNHDIQIKVFDENQILKTLNNIEITSLQGFNMNLSPQTIVKNFKDCQKIKLVGKAQLKITDSHMQLQRIKGISLSIQNNKSDIWQLRGVTLEGVSVKIDDHDEKVENKEQKPLFDSHEIPTQYMRSCLLSPKYYSVVNKVLAKVLSSEKHEYQLRLTILKFLNKIMKVDRDFIPLVLQELNLDKFLKFNLFDKDTGGISYIFEFMQNFQRDLKFCYDLYNILLNYVHSLPDTLISYHGYEAFIGMLKWSIPINPEKTLSSLLQTLYQQICLQKVSALQTKECIYFRTRQQFNIFPFDLVVFKPQKIQQGLNKKDQQPQIIQEPRNILPVKQILKHKYEYHHIYDVQFETEMQVTDLKLYLGVLEQAQYKLIIKIFGKDKLIYYGHFEEHIFAQYTQINISQKHSSYEDSLLINNLNFKGTELKVVIEFGISYSSMPKQTNKVKPPDSLIELYGQPTNPSINQKRLKDMLDKKAQEFWTEKAKLFKVGNSVPMLYLTESSQTYKIVPQGTQSAPSQKVEEEKVQSEQQKPQQDQISTIPAPPKYGELQTLQEELKGKIRANDSNIKEIVNKIQNIQANLYSSQVEQTEYNKEIIPSLEYYMNITSDFAKLIMNIIKTQKMGKEKLCQIFRQIEQNGQLSIVCFEFFKRYIAYDQGPVMQDALQFITECLYPVMSLVEKKSFTFKVIEEFLSTAQITFSQKAVLEALTKIGIPEGELISFMIEKLNIKQSPNQSMDLGKLQPFIFMSSVLILAHNSLKQIEIPEPGQVLHKGVCCSCCQAKMIIGWRYKCGHCIGDINLDEKCVEKHLQENPDHILIIIQEPLPYNPKTVKVSKLWQNKSLLPQFKFKEEKPDEAQKNVHDEFACENCGRKPIIGNCYRCVNCEDYNLCQDCYSQNLFDHFSYHVFMRLHKPLQHSEKNPTILLQVLDHRLYAQDHQSQSEKKDKSVSHKQQELAITQDEEEDFEDLVPLSVARSQSVPMPAKQNSSAKQIQQQEHKYERLEFDQQFIILFHTCAWICQDSLKVFTKEEKVVLLKLNIETMLQLIKLTSVKHIYECISNKDTFFHLLVSILQLNSKELITLYKNLLDFVRQPPTLQRKIKEEQKANDKLKQAAKSSDKKQQLNEDQATMRLLLETMISHVQNFLKWLVDIALNPDLAKIQVPQGSEQWANLIFNYQNQRVWLEHLSLILELFIKSTDELKDLTKSQVGPIINGVLEKIPEEANENEQDDELLPISMKRTISVPLAKGQTPKQQQTTSLSLQLIKSLVQLLYLNDQSYQSKQSSQKPSHFKEMEPSTKYLSQMWSLVLKSLTAVSINQLIEARIFDSLVNAFLISTEEIKQITFPQILSISETIAKQSVHANDISKFISNLLFTTLENVTNNHHEKVGYSICQGWLDILISSSVARPPDYESKNQVYAKMSAEEVSTFLKKTSQYLNNFLNKGNFDGPTGANPLMVMRLNLASDLIYVIRYAENKNKPGTLAILELFSSCASNLKLRKEYQESMDNLLAWLFLNSRQPRDDQELSNLGNTSTYTPATTKVKTITDHIESILSILSDSDNNEQAIKIALSSMTSIVKKMNKTILDLSQNNSLGFDMSVKLSEKTNEYFIKLLGQWLISDTVASYFVFDLGGFEFLLDTIGVGEGDQSQNYYSNGLQYEVVSSQEELKETEHQQDQVVQPLSNAFASLAGSDLASYLETNIQEFQQQAQKLIPAAAGQVKEENVQKLQFDKTLLQLQEFSKSLAMVSNNGGDPVAAHQKTDWSVNKRAYKHRIIIKPLVGQLRSEYWILFSLSSPIEVKEIQIGFNNYWGSDTEVYSEPLSVLVEAGMDENNLSLVCNLQIVKDDAFGSVSATVFGANLQTFAIQNTENISSTIEDIIQQKLQSLQNFKIQYVKFCMRRHVLTCLENSPLSTKFTKPPAFGINFISILGFDLSKVGDYLSSIKSDQRRTALEVLSIICSGDFSSILKVIANQQQTIEKMKKSFNQLASLVSVKKNLIEPTFIAISTYNTEMGDWIINEFLKAGKIYKHASLVGEIVMCNKNELPRRLRILQEYVMTQLVQFCEEERSNHGSQIKKLLPFIEIFIQTLRLAAPDIQDVQIDLKITEQQLLKIVSLLSSATQEREQQTKMLIQLLVLLLCPPPPFTNNQVDVYEFAIKYLIDQSSLENQETQHQKEHLASILSVARREIAIELLSKEIKFKKITNPDHDISGDDNANKSQLQHSLKFWIDVAHDMKVKACLNDLKLPMKLYTILKESSPEKNDKIIRNDNMIGEEEILLYIELIKILVAGDKDLEAELSKNLMKDLEYLSKIRDMNFVNKVFLQLLRIESTIPVCLWPYDSDNKKWLSSYKPQMLSDKAQIPSNNNNFVPSQLLQGEKRSVFIKNFKEIVGQHSKGNIKKLLGSNWQLCHSQTEQGQVNQFQGFWKNIENKAPVVILLHVETAAGNPIIFGCYASKGIPAMPANLAQDQDYAVPASPEDFVFCYIDDNNFHHLTPKSGPIIAMYTDYEGGGAISVASDFFLVSFSYDFVFTVGVQYELMKIQEKTNPPPEKEIPESGVTFKKIEVWSFSSGASTSVQNIIQANQKIKFQTISQLDGSLGEIQMKQDFKHPWFNELSPFVNYRTNPVFMVPKHLSVSQLSKILLDSNVSFKPRFNHLLTQNKEIMSEIYEDLNQNIELKQLFNGIIDLEYDVNQLLNIQGQDDHKDKSSLEYEEATTEGSLIQGYVPKMGLFEQFENHGGVKQIISVTLQSLKLWKAEELAKSWELWLKELESFSEIPLFFQLFLKNSRCKDLLFKVLAGLPDTEITAEGGKTDSVAKIRWEEEQKVAVQFNYKILSEAFSISNDLKLRDIAMQCGLLPRILERLGAISGEKPRYIEVEAEKSQIEEETKEEKPQIQQAEKNFEKKKRKGVGYSSKVGQTFNVAAYLENKKQRNDQIKNLIDICTNFINCKEWKAGEQVLDIILESALLPLLESAFRNGSWLEMAKEYEVYHSYLALARAIAGQKKLLKCLIEVDPKYKPLQHDPIYKLLAKLNELAEIFINCLNQQQKSEQDSEIPETLAREVIKTYKIVQAAIDKVFKNKRDDNFVENALNLPLPLAYKSLLSDMRFDYMDIRDPQNESNYKHHYNSIAQQNQNPPSSKMVRLAQELADLSNALPCEHTNSIYVRVDQQRVDLMKALICGASNTPYAHGCFEYDIFCDNNYPRDPPKMNLITTGNGAVRYNPNLYACGKVCLSLLGTWRGSATENWDPKLSTILQVLLSTQAIIMSEEVYFNEPGFENEAGTPEGEKKNEGYSNIVRYCNIKFAMIEQIKRPPRGFETVIKRHFYIKKPEILKEVNYWIELADKNEATYGGLVNDHNYNWANQFKQTKTKYKEMLQAVVKQLEEELNKLERPTDYELKEQQAQKRKITQKKQKRQAITEGKAELDLDMGTDEDEEQINTESKKEMNVEDEAVKDRWSRYIGAMGVEAVAKQSSANIFVSGAGALGVEISKNIVLSGCKTFTLHDNKPITYRDLSGQFFLNLEEDLLNDKKKKATRGEACLPRLQQLNYYVRCKLADPVAIPLNVSAIEKEPWNFGIYDVIILTEASYEEIQFFDEYCRSKGKKFISADSFGVFTRVFTDFGEKFEVLDKNGEDLQDVMIKNITNEEEGLVELIPNMKHKFEDGDEVLITKVEGMKLLPGEKHNDPAVKSDSINDTIHKVKVISPYTFRIGDTRKFDKYERNGFAKQLKTKVIKNFKSFSETMMKGSAELPLDGNLSIADFEKMSNNQLSHIAFEALDIFKQAYKRMPGVWNKEDAERMIIYAKEVAKRYGMNIEEDFKPESYGTKFLYLFSFTCQGVFNPLCAFMGGFVAQECMKAITAKFTPIHQVFYYDAFEVLPDFDPTKHLNGDSENYFEEKYVKELIKTKETNQRYDGLRIVVGQNLIEKLANTRLFMVGAGAIGCELLKNYAMLGVGVGKPQPKKKLTGGQIVLTDPDVIEVSNLNRQFLFREKHLRKPKSSTAASAAIYMNRDLKENIIARLDKVHEGTSHIFTDQFFEELTVVTNALDNLAARIYIDSRCVTAKTPLLESGTLGPKGHVQVVLPFKTESYGSMNDPEDNTEIPHCTLKMFPEETLHCVEWARDKFSRYFTQGPQSTVKILEEGTNFNPISQQDIMSLKEAIKILKKRPKNFNDCIEYARIKFEKLFNHDIQQLLHVYPIDSKTKDGNYFWSLPKRPPLPINFDQTNPIHCQFIASTACLRANIFKIEIPSKTPRTEEFRKELGKLAAKIDVPEFKPDDEKAKEIQASVNKEVGKEEPKEEESKEEEPKVDPNDLESLMKDFKQLLQDLPVKKGETYIEKLIKPEEFEKDNDANYHIDFIYAMSNCRSNNYKLDFMDWITVKLKAGRIVPALATTTAAIAGLQTLELVKLIKQCKKADHRNVFLNIAVPIMQASEPADVLKTKLTENIEVTLWDRWEVKKGKNIKLHEVIKYIEETYKGLEVRDVMKGNTPIYFNAIMGAPGKEKEKEKILNSKVTDLVGTDSDDKYTDLTLTCVRVGDIEDKIITGVPPVRVYFE